MGTINALFTIGGGKIRSPGQYTFPNDRNDRRSKNHPAESNEKIHASVRVRLARLGAAGWRCPALRNWRLEEPVGDGPYTWVLTHPISGAEQARLPEAELDDFERTLMDGATRGQVNQLVPQGQPGDAGEGPDQVAVALATLESQLPNNVQAYINEDENY
jgi:hypothetical protein